MGVVLYGILLAHLNAYAEQYSSIGITFVMTVVFKKLIKAGGNTDHADLVGIGGGVLTVGEIAKLLKDMKSSSQGVIGDSEESSKIIGGVLGGAVDSIKELLVK